MNPCTHIVHRRLHRARGIALITSLLVLTMLTLLALAMFRGFGLQQKIAGNVREKERAFQAAENALQYGERWVAPGTAGTGADCREAPIDPAGTPGGGPRVCSEALAHARDPSVWAATFDYAPEGMTVAAGGGTSIAAGGLPDINYAKIPGLHVAYLGLSPNGQDMLYTVTAAGYGGSTASTAVIQSVYASTPKNRPLDNP